MAASSKCFQHANAQRHLEDNSARTGNTEGLKGYRSTLGAGLPSHLLHRCLHLSPRSPVQPEPFFTASLQTPFCQRRMSRETVSMLYDSFVICVTSFVITSQTALASRVQGQTTHKAKPAAELPGERRVRQAEHPAPRPCSSTSAMAFQETARSRRGGKAKTKA